MEIKVGRGAVKELSEKGEGVALIATLNVVDHDDDVTMPGAFGEQHVQVVPAHDWQASPIGKARIHEEGDEVHADFRLNLKTRLGQDWYEALRFDLDHPPARQEWSYGFAVGESGQGDHGGRRVRFLKKLIVREISPVLAGAGIGTATLAMKDAGGVRLVEQLDAVIGGAERLAARLSDLKRLRAEEGREIPAGRKAQVRELMRLLGEIEGGLGAALAGGGGMPKEAGRLAARHLALRKKVLDAGIGIA